MAKRVSKPAASVSKIAPKKVLDEAAVVKVDPEASAPAPGPDKASPSQRNESAIPVAGFGASAGGLEAFTQLLHSLSPTTGMAYVLVQHLDPKRESMLAEILSRATTMPVTEVHQPTSVEANHIYVAPPGADVRIQSRVLHLLRYTAKHEPHMSIDYFFRSLAEDLKNKAIGVILSGTGSDGSLGLKAIKAEGGVTFAQDEKSAKHDGMVRSAISGGSVDFVLPPDQIAAELARLGNHPYVTPSQREPPEEVIPVPDDVLAQILRRIHSVTNVDLTLYKPNTIKRRVLRRIFLSKAESIEAYLHVLQNNPAEVHALYEDMLINVTQFFRDPDTFQALKTNIFPRMPVEDGTGGIRVWVPGCSTGEEVYSLAICLVEYLEETERPGHIQLFGTEISEQALDRARVGLYSESIAADVSPERLRRFFVKVENGYQISKRIRDYCIFARQNLTKDPPFSKLDLISCRNVLIYLGPALQKKVLPIFHYALKPTGFLLLGSSETVGAYADLFTMADKRFKIFGKRDAPARVPTDFAYGGLAAESNMASEQQRRGVVSLAPGDMQKEADRLILSRYGPPGVIINEELDVIQFRGQTGVYLEPSPGPASYNILKMTREGLLSDFRGAIHRAISGDMVIRREGLRVKYNGGYREFDLEILPLRKPPAGGRFFLVLFHPIQKALQKLAKAKATRGTKIEPEEIKNLRSELAATKESLQSIIEEQEASNEELRSANEEIQSSNEELHSTNEELETAKEELQSSNEELNTVNEELENRNLQMAHVNDDLRNLLSSVNIPIVMVGSDLRIRRFTPQAEKVMSIIPGDAGRPIGNIRTNINVPNLEQLLTDVIETLRTHEAEVQDSSGRWYLMRIRPYRTEDNKIEGAVLALVDIDDLKRSLDEVRKGRDFNQSIIEMTRSSVLVLDSELRAKQANPVFYNTFQLTPPEVIDQTIDTIGGGQWKFLSLHSVFNKLLSDHGRLNDFEVEHEFPRVGHKVLVMNARQFQDGSGGPSVLLAIDDITDHKK